AGSSGRTRSRSRSQAGDSAPGSPPNTRPRSPTRRAPTGGTLSPGARPAAPTVALVGRTEFDLRQAARWDEAAQTRTDTICPYCGVGCLLTLHVQDNRIVKVTSPFDHDVTRGNLCVKGRFGWAYVHATGEDPQPPRADRPGSPTSMDPSG